MYKSLLLAIFTCTSLISFSQNEVDALRYSWDDLMGTARNISMGGAFGALGADMSSFSSNPAGLGLYRRSDFSLTPTFSLTNTNAQYLNNEQMKNRLNLGFNSAGYVASYESESEQIVRFNFGIAYNKLNTYHQNIAIVGNGVSTSLLDVFASQAEGTSPENLTDDFPFGSGLAYQTYLINPIDTLGSNIYSTEIPDGNVNQLQTIERSGVKNETLIGGGMNISDKLFLGVSLGLSKTEFDENTKYKESTNVDSLELDNFVFENNLYATGTGAKLKAGLIVKPTDWFRIGVAVHTGTWMVMKETYSTNMTANFKGEDAYYYEAPLGEYEYRLRTPGKLLGDMAFVIGKLGIISLGYEYIDFSSSKLKTSNTIYDDYDFSGENDAIATIYKKTHNFKAGVEWRVMKPLAIRAGVNFQESPYKDGLTESNNDVISYTGGVGFRKKGFYADLAYSLRTGSVDFYLYDPAMSESATLNTNRTQVAATLGFRF